MFCKGYFNEADVACPGRPGIIRVDFSAKGLTSESFLEIVRTFSQGCMKYLNLSDNDFSKLSPIDHICNQSFSRLETLNLARCNLHGSNLYEIAKFLEGSKFESIELILSGNPLASGSKHLSMLNNKIHSLKLDGCQVCDDDLEDMLAENGLGEKLRCLDLSCNSIRSNTLTRIANVMKANESLVNINLSQNPLTDDCVESFATFLHESNKTLSSLNLSQTNLKAGTARKLFRVPRLRNLCLFNNNLGGGDFFSCPTTAKLIASSDLSTLDLCGNNATDLDTLLSTLYACYKEDNGATRKLDVLELGGNIVRESDEIWISKLKRLGLDVARDRPTQNQI